MSSSVPWPLKIIVKMVLARMPVPYRVWKRIGVFRHGQMEDFAYSDAVFSGHFARARIAIGKPFSCLELGPGDSLFSAILAKARGASRCWLVDVGDFADRDIERYRRAAAHVADKFGVALPPAALADFPALMAWCGASYLTGGVESLRQIPPGSVDLIFSHAMLEHVRRRDFMPLLRELRRVLAPGGICSHRVDLQDHLAGALNNLRFSDRLWESECFARSGFYTNRLRFNEMIEMFGEAGFETELIGIQRWPDLPTPRDAMAPAFRALADDDLRVSGFDVLLRSRGHTA